MKPLARWLPDGKRLHLQHGPSDLVIYAEGMRQRAYEAAVARFQTVIDEVSSELSILKTAVHPSSVYPEGNIAVSMFHAAVQFSDRGYITPMAAVAGAIADEILEEMIEAAPLQRAYVNNGGDIALYLAPKTSFNTLMAGVDGRVLGHVTILAGSGVRGMATSGRHGRSLSRGIADSVTVLARSAALADAAATIVANSVNLQKHPAVQCIAANTIREDSDLGTMSVVTHCGPLSEGDKTIALNNGLSEAEVFCQSGKIKGASLYLQGRTVSTKSASKFINHGEEAYV